MAELEQLTEIYRNYERGLLEAVKHRAPLAGVFGMPEDPQQQLCGLRFFEDTADWVKEFAGEDHTAQVCAQAVEWILQFPAEHKGQKTYWHSYAAIQHAAALIPRLERSDAERLGEHFIKWYPKLEWLPVQQEVYEMLIKQSGAEEQKKQSFFQQWGKQVFLLLVGLTIAHLGVTLFLLAELGSDPFNVMIQGLHHTLGLPITHGMVHIAVSLLIILVLLVVDRSYIRIGTFLCMILGGPIIDLFTLLLQGIVNADAALWIRVLSVVLGCGILAFGMTIVIKSEAGTGPNDLVAVVLSDKRRWKFGPVRVGVDLCFAAVGYLLGGTLNYGTIICMTLVGPVAQFFMPFSERLCRAALKKAKMTSSM